MSQSEIENAALEVRRGNAALANALDQLMSKVEGAAEKAARLIGAARNPREAVGEYAKRYADSSRRAIGALYSDTRDSLARITAKTLRDRKRLALLAVVGVGALGLLFGLRARANSRRRAPGSTAMSEFLERCRTRWLCAMNCVALYDDLLSKSPAQHRLRLLQIREEEKKHALLLANVIRSRAGDSSDLFKSRTVAGVIKSASFPAALDAVLAAELVDNASWRLLSKMARELGLSDVAARFAQALKKETKHLGYIQGLTTHSALARLRA